MRVVVLASLVVAGSGCASTSSSSAASAPPAPAVSPETPRWITQRPPSCGAPTHGLDEPGCASSPSATGAVATPPTPEAPVTVAADDVADALREAEEARPKPRPRASGATVGLSDAFTDAPFGLVAPPTGGAGIGLGRLGTRGSGGGVGDARGLGGLGLGGLGTRGASHASLEVKSVSGGPKGSPAAALHRSVARISPSLATCVDAARAAKQSVPKAVTVAVQVDASGQVTSASSKAPGPLGPCLDKAIGRVKFPTKTAWSGSIALRIASP